MAKRIKLESQFEKLYPDAEADIHFECVSKSGQIEVIPGHKHVLFMANDVFNLLFFDYDKQYRLYKIVGVTSEAFKEFLQLFYMDHAQLSGGNALQVMQMLKTFNIRDHSSAFKMLLKAEFTREKLFWGHQLAVWLNQDDLKGYCEEEIAFNTKEVFKLSDFLVCDRSTLHHILSQDRLTCDEATVFNACITWSKAVCERKGLNSDNGHNLRQQLGNLVYQIRFRSMTLAEFNTLAISSGIRFTIDDWQELFQLFNSKEFSPKRFHGGLRLKPFTWDPKRFVCVRRDDPLDPNEWWRKRRVQRNEITVFSTNKPLLLGELWFVEIKFPKSDFTTKCVCKSNITIFQKTYIANSPQCNVIFSGSVTLNDRRTSFRLPDPISVKPDCLYEIHLEQCDMSYFKLDMILDDVIEIEDTIVRFDDGGNGLVSAICFNRLRV